MMSVVTVVIMALPLIILMILLGIYLILYGTTNKYLAIPYSTIGTLLVTIGIK